MTVNGACGKDIYSECGHDLYSGLISPSEEAQHTISYVPTEEIVPTKYGSNCSHVHAEIHIIEWGKVPSLFQLTLQQNISNISRNGHKWLDTSDAEKRIDKAHIYWLVCVGVCL